MKYFYTIALFFSGLQVTFCQLIKTPNIHFKGSKVEWAHTVRDTFEPDAPFTFLRASEKDLGVIITRPKENGNTVIFNVSNNNVFYTGTLVSAYDLKSGNIIWEKNYNPHYENTYAYTFTMEMDFSQEGNLILRGYKSRMPFQGAKYNGHYIEREVDLGSGSTVKEYLNTKDMIITNVRTNPAKSKNQSSFFVYSSWFANKFWPTLIDVENDTIITSYENDPERVVLFDGITSSSRGIMRVDGPFTTNNETFTYLAQYLEDDKLRQWIWKTESNAKLIELREITSQLGEFYMRTEQKEGFIELITSPDDVFKNGHQGYIFMDMEGNILRRTSKMTIDGKKVGHLSVNNLKNTEDILCVVRFQEDNDIYIYRETKEKKYIQAAHLINPNSKAFAFLPGHIFQSSDHGLVISGSFSMDTVFSSTRRCLLNCLGWPVIMKMTAETLGIPTSTSDVGQQNVAYSITPNPSSQNINLIIPEIQNPVTLHITDQLGRSVWVQDISDTETVIDISGLTSGMYFVSLVDASSGRQVGKVQKLVKVE